MSADVASLEPEARPLLEVEHLVVEHHLPGGARVHAVSDVSLTLQRGETLGLVGESGCGKSSIARSILMLRPPNSGSVRLNGEELVGIGPARLRELRSQMLIIFQDPISSLNPRRTVRSIVAEGLVIQGRPLPHKELVDQTLRDVGLDPDAVGGRRPHELSGGQCQRVAIARALVLQPALLVCDEAVSALDVSVRAQILNLLEDLRERLGLTLLFISHDLAVVNAVSDRVAIMYLGKICELAPVDAIYGDPQHPYTHGLLEAIPQPDPDIPLAPLELVGETASPIDPPSGCRFRTRCPRAEALCAADEPLLRPLTDGHYVACHFPGPTHSFSMIQTGTTGDDSTGA
ncbi:MAG: ATP-binding cassette domain-containing protein [Acidobacteria bacterium]|nr:ATP-binding cassette domain-containing protein [Acidobacteriota bacterium]